MKTLKFSALPKTVQILVLNDAKADQKLEADYDRAKFYKQNGFSSYSEYREYLINRKPSASLMKDCVISVVWQTYKASGFQEWMNLVPDVNKILTNKINSEMLSMAEINRGVQ